MNNCRGRDEVGTTLVGESFFCNLPGRGQNKMAFCNFHNLAKKYSKMSHVESWNSLGTKSSHETEFTSIC